MRAAFKIAEQLMIQRIVSNKFPISGKTKAGLGLGVLSSLLLFIGTGFFMYAGFLWLSNNFTPDAAAALAGVMAFGFAGITGLISLAIIRYKDNKAQKIKSEIQTKIIKALEVANDEFGEPIKNNPKTAACAATLVGFMLGNRIQ